MQVTQTTDDNYGQIYIGAVNWSLMVVTLGLVLTFRSSDNLASAYGIAVSLTMLMTSCLLLVVMREIWLWGRYTSLLVAGFFLLIDSGFVIANLAKLTHGGYIPLFLATLIYLIMFVWNHGVMQITKNINECPLPIDDFLREVDNRQIPRVPSAGVFLTRMQNTTPPVMSWHVMRNYALYQNLLALTVVVLSIPGFNGTERVKLKQMAPEVWQVVVNYGFMDRPNVPLLLQSTVPFNTSIDFDHVTYYIGHETIVGKPSGGLPHWQRKRFALMVRNSSHVTDYYSLPSNQLIEIGRQIAIQGSVSL